MRCEISLILAAIFLASATEAIDLWQTGGDGSLQRELFHHLIKAA